MPRPQRATLARWFATALLMAGCAAPASDRSTQTAPPETTASAPPDEAPLDVERKAVLTAAVKANGLPAAVALLKQWMSEDLNIAAQCHSLARHIGLVAAPEAGLTAPLEDWCEYGLLHGLLFGIAETTGSIPAFADLAVPYCTKSGRTHDERGRCFHGVGHGIAVASHNDITAALDACAAIRVEGADQCFGGMLMEFGEDRLAAGGWAVGHSAENSPQVLTVSDAQISALCTGRPLPCFQRLWMFHAPPRAAIRDDGDAALAAAVCAPPMTPAERRVCLEGFGEFAGVMWMVFGRAEGQSWPPDSAEEAAAMASAAVTRCTAYPDPGACIYGLVPQTTSNLHTANWPYIPDFCAVVPQQWHRDCEAAVYAAKTGGRAPE